MRVYFRVDDIDNVDYDANGYQLKPTQPTNDVIRGVANIDRSQLTFRNINLMAILGYQRVNQGGTFNIKVVEVRAINENGNNVIDYDSPAQLRTSNVMLSGSGLSFLNGKTENLLCQFTNFNPNEELVFENVAFHRGDLNDYQHYYEYSKTNRGGTTNDFYTFMNQENLTTTVITNIGLSLTRYRVNATPTPGDPNLPGNISSLNDKIMRAGRAVRFSDNLFWLYVEDAGDGSLPARTGAQYNGRVTITILPENNQWFHRRFTDNVQEDDFNNELTAYMPKSDTIDLTFELRDILTNTLQPVIAEPNGKVYPSIEFVLDIY